MKNMRLIVGFILGLVAAFPLFSLGAPSLASRLAGRIVLSVQEHGEAWYIDPLTLTRTYLGQPDDAFAIMQKYGLGITTADLNLIPMSRDSVGQAIYNTVPFSAQAPLGEWSDPRQQDGCEEASALMAVSWARGDNPSPEEFKATITAMSDWELDQFGYYIDTGINDTAERLIKTYLGHTKYEVQRSVNTDDLITALEAGSIALVPINGQVFEPFHYTPPGPARHMIVVHGYDPAQQLFSVHDPGTSQGANLQVTEEVMERSWRDYASGNQVAVPELPRSMIVISR